MSVPPRVIPVLLVSDGYLVKPVKFKGEQYIGDPINAVRIFNEKQVDELMVLDIDATRTGTGVNFALLEAVASEAFMPVGYGGGLATTGDARRVIEIGLEKVILNAVAVERPEVVSEISASLGASSTVVAIDAKPRFTGGWDTFIRRGTKRTRQRPAEAAVAAERLGAGEIVVTAIDREGTRGGYDLRLIDSVASAVSVPVVALGGAGSVADFAQALDAGASAVAAGTMFVLNGKHRAVLISYPSPEQVRSLAG